jgi:chloramphenicol 3-O-phosphotransferase
MISDMVFPNKHDDAFVSRSHYRGTMETETSPRIILLNGVGSVGKSSVARAFQEIATTPYLHVQMNSFLDMMPRALANHTDGFRFEAVQNTEKPEVAILEGPVGCLALATVLKGTRFSWGANIARVSGKIAPHEAA